MERFGVIAIREGDGVEKNLILDLCAEQGQIRLNVFGEEMPHSQFVMHARLWSEVRIDPNLSIEKIIDNEFVRKGKAETTVDPGKEGRLTAIKEAQAGAVSIGVVVNRIVEGPQKPCEIFLGEIVLNPFSART
jgi:hypothetical protein